MKYRKLLKDWLSIIADKKAIIKAEPTCNKNTRVSDLGEKNSKFIAELIRESIAEIESSMRVSPYNPAHTLYGDCCGIFNVINDDGILCCNECGMTINKLLETLSPITEQGEVTPEETKKALLEMFQCCEYCDNLDIDATIKGGAWACNLEKLECDFKLNRLIREYGDQCRGESEKNKIFDGHKIHIIHDDKTNDVHEGVLICVNDKESVFHIKSKPEDK